MIRSFRCPLTEILFREGRVPARWREIERVARRKLEMLNAATRIEDLRVPPGNRLQRLVGDRSGQWSIRINDRWCLCFAWKDGDAHEVEIVDYHR